MSGSRDDSGFALVEAIAALGVAAIAAAGLMATLSLAGTRTAEADVRETALRQAQAVLADCLAVADTNLVPRRGVLTDAGLSWTVSITEPGDPYPGIQQFDVEVSWKAAGKKGATHLAAYRIAPPKQAGQ